MMSLGPKGPFVQYWVIVKRTPDNFCERDMRQFAQLWFELDAAEADRHYPRNNAGNKSLGLLRRMMANFVIIGRRAASDRFVDLHRDGSIAMVTEHALFKFKVMKPDAPVLSMGCPQPVLKQTRSTNA